MEVSTPADFALCVAMNLPLVLALGLIAWRLSWPDIALLALPAVVAIWVVLAAIYAFQTWQTYRVNQEMFEHGVPPLRRYKFRQVASLALIYMVTFGSELAVVSILPLFFVKTFPDLSLVTAGLLAAVYSSLAAVARPIGGWVSDHYGRKRVLGVLIVGLGLGYAGMAQIDSTWSMGLALATIMACAVCVHGSNGAVFALVPLVQRRMTGQIAGMTGAYGNVGGVVLLVVSSFVDYSTFLLVIAGSAVISLLALAALQEPRGHMSEVLEDGSVQLIEVG